MSGASYGLEPTTSTACSVTGFSNTGRGAVSIHDRSNHVLSRKSKGCAAEARRQPQIEDV
jgi:hypothetical protein